MKMYVVLDTETSGTDANKHEIIQIGAALVNKQLEITSEYQCRLQFDEGRATPEALEINHYAKEDWAEAESQKKGLTDFIRWLEPARQVRMMGRSGRPWNAAISIAYNLPFDDKMLRLSCKRHGLFYPVAFKSLDVMQLALWKWRDQNEMPSHKLQDVAERLGVETGKAHDAMGDVYTTINVLRALFPKGL